jgi:hypothetical protein
VVYETGECNRAAPDCQPRALVRRRSSGHS